MGGEKWTYLEEEKWNQKKKYSMNNSCHLKMPLSDPINAITFLLNSYIQAT